MKKFIMEGHTKIDENIFLNASDFMKMLKDQGMVIGPRTVFESNTVNGIPLEQYRDRLLAKKRLLTPSEISKAQIWGKISQKRVYQIIMENLPEDEIFKGENGYIKISREAVKSIAASRGFQI